MDLHKGQSGHASRLYICCERNGGKRIAPSASLRTPSVNTSPPSFIKIGGMPQLEKEGIRIQKEYCD